MFLKRLLIESKNRVIRDIKFRKGLNLIVDETPEISTDIHKTTGNNVGKTTTVRLIDYCLGSTGDNIYKDAEFSNRNNTRIEEFLKNEQVIITLELVSDLENESSHKITIRRNFLAGKDKVQEINGNKISSKDFDMTLKRDILNTNVKKPTFRQIISKNIRDEKNKLSHIVKVLNPFTTKEEYEALYLFWLGVNTKSHEKNKS